MMIKNGTMSEVGTKIKSVTYSVYDEEWNHDFSLE